MTFWTDYQDSIPVPIPGTDDMTTASVVTVGYSQAVLDYQRTEEGWRFTSFCASDDLDLNADTVFTFSYDGDSFASDEPAMDTWSDYKLGCWLLHADAMGEGASTLLTQRFLEDPGDVVCGPYPPGTESLRTRPDRFGISRLRLCLVFSGGTSTVRGNSQYLSAEE